MKELDPPHQDNTIILQKLHVDLPKGTKAIPRGCKMWVINPETEEVEEFKPKMTRIVSKEDQAKIKKRAFYEPVAATIHHKVEYSPKMYYNMAINKKSSLKKYYKSQYYAAYRHRKQTSGNTS